MRKIALVVAAAGASAAAYYYLRLRRPEPQVLTQPITRGDVEEMVGATGTLEAVTTVQVGTQVSGTIEALYADYNSKVRKGQVIAKLDPALYQTQLDQARANVVRSEADLDRLRLSEADALRKLERARKLAADLLIPQNELDTTEATYNSAAAQVRSAVAQVTQARASLSQAEVSLEKTVIGAPISGIVIARNVDVGQTVAASFQAPTLFVIAADLTKMRVNASVHEADIGRIQAGQGVRFRVDSYPSEEFPGRVSSVRLSPVVQQNVVTYATVIDVPNSELKLKPGMTATVTIQIAAREDVLLVPNAALRFRPTAEMFAALGQSEPQPSDVEPHSPIARPTRQSARPSPTVQETHGTTGRVWIYEAKLLSSRRVRLGISDGTRSELLGVELSEGTEVVTNILIGDESFPAATTTTNPLMGPQRPRGPGGGGPR